MQDVPNPFLSDYQQAVLHEMEITPWLLAGNGSESHKSLDVPDTKQVPTSPEAVKAADSDNALARLAKLKQTMPSHVESAVKTISCEEVLLTFSLENSLLFNDILLAYGADGIACKLVQLNELKGFKDYPLALIKGEEIALVDNVLSICALEDLQQIESKRRLWRVLQRSGKV